MFQVTTAFQVAILLGKVEAPSKVQNPWDVYVKTGTKPASKLSEENRTIDVYDRLDVNGRLLILGAPGSGKTTTLLQLAQELINRAYSDSNKPIPVLLNLSSWKDDFQSINDWIVDDLNFKYGVRKDIGKKWLEKEKIIPLLDGLDEVAAARQTLCAQKINDFLKPENWQKNIVVCSQIEEYEIIEATLKLNSSIILQPLSKEQIENYLLKISNESVYSAIEKDESLFKLTQIPLFLSILVIVVENISWSKWQTFTKTKERLKYYFKH